MTSDIVRELRSWAKGLDGHDFQQAKDRVALLLDAANQIEAQTKVKVEHPEDCLRILIILRQNGMPATIEIAEWLWKNYSESMCAGWLGLSNDDDKILSHIKEAFSAKTWD